MKKEVIDTKKKIKAKQAKKPEKKPPNKNASCSSSSEGKDLNENVAIDVTNEDSSDDSSSSDEEGGGEVADTEEETSLKVDDICALCNSPWVYGFPESRPLQEVMIICDGCDGSYHALCVGK